MKLLLLMGLAILFFPMTPAGAEPEDNLSIRDRAYNALRGSKECHTSSVQSITCTYVLGDTLVFSIEGVGEVDAAITFNYVAPDSRYYARFASRPGCVLIQRKSTDTITPLQAMNDLAYVSLRNGKVYNNWPDCKDGQ